MEGLKSGEVSVENENEAEEGVRRREGGRDDNNFRHGVWEKHGRAKTWVDAKRGQRSRARDSQL